MNEIVHKFLLAGDKFMPQMHLRQPGFTYSACGPFIENKERIKKIKETGNSRYIYQKELDKACFQQDMAYGDFKDSNKLLIKYYVINHLILLKIQNIQRRSMRYIKEVLFQWFINFLIKKLLVVVLKMKIFLIKNYRKNYTNQ